MCVIFGIFGFRRYILALIPPRVKRNKSLNADNSINIPFIPTGGVEKKNIKDWFEAGAIAVGVGSNLCPKGLITTGEFNKITNIAREFESIDYQVDKDGNIISRLVDKDNHTIDATRYAFEEDMKQDEWEVL